MIYFIAGILFGAGVCGHALRLLQGETGTRRFIVITSLFTYTLGTLLCLAGSLVGVWMAIILPLIAVIVITSSTEKPDPFQVVLGAFLIANAVLAYTVLC